MTSSHIFVIDHLLDAKNSAENVRTNHLKHRSKAEQYTNIISQPKRIFTISLMVLIIGIVYTILCMVYIGDPTIQMLLVIYVLSICILGMVNIWCRYLVQESQDTTG